MSSLWLEKSPGVQTELHPRVNARLMGIGESTPHLLFHGPSGAGKRTRVLLMLHQLFGPLAAKVKLEQRSFQAQQKKEVMLSTLVSNYHIEITPADVGKSDRYVIQTLFREIAENAPLLPTLKTHEPTLETNESSVAAPVLPTLKKNSEASMVDGKRAGVGFKVVVLNEADRMSLEAQASLRRMLEKYMHKCRVILCCERINRLIEPIRSRCQLIRVPAPQVGDLANLLRSIAQKNGFTPSDDTLFKIAECRDARRAILSLQKAQVDGKNIPAEADWEIELKNIGGRLIESPSPRAVQEARALIVELAHIPPDLVLNILAKTMLLSARSLTIQLELSGLIADTDWRLDRGSKPVLHLDHLITRAALAAAQQQ